MKFHDGNRDKMTEKVGVWIPVDQNGTSFKQIFETDGMTYADLVEKVYRGIDLYLVHSVDNSFNYIFPMAFAENRLIPLSAIMANNYSIMPTGKKLGELECSSITPNYWTCDCKKNFVWHKIVQKCHRCNQTVGNARNRLPDLNNLIKWDYLVP